MDNPKVSVVIPVYNTGKVLCRCIASLTSQTYQNIEYIFVDDGSTDNSCAILETAAKSDKRICFLRQENAGVSAARNLGMNHASGRYLLFCDSDDTVSPNWCESLVRTIQEHPTSWIVCGIQTIDEFGHEVFAAHLPNHTNTTQKLDKSAYFELFRRGYSISVNNKIFDVDLLHRAAIRFDESCKRGEDVIFCIEYFMETDNVVVIDELLYQYYRYEKAETLTNRWHRDDYKDLCVLYNWRKKVIAPENSDEFRFYYWNLFLNSLDNTLEFDEWHNLIARFQLNHTIIAQPEFQELLLHCGKSCLNFVAFWCLRIKWYGGYHFIQRLHLMKQNFHQQKND